MRVTFVDLSYMYCIILFLLGFVNYVHKYCSHRKSPFLCFSFSWIDIRFRQLIQLQLKKGIFWRKQMDGWLIQFIQGKGKELVNGHALNISPGLPVGFTAIPIAIGAKWNKFGGEFSEVNFCQRPHGINLD